MIIRIAPDIEQIRCRLRAAKGVFETLDKDTAIEILLVEINGLLDYLSDIDRINDTFIFELGGGIGSTREKPLICNRKIPH